jgi:hypothetical protein
MLAYLDVCMSKYVVSDERHNGYMIDLFVAFKGEDET